MDFLLGEYEDLRRGDLIGERRGERLGDLEYVLGDLGLEYDLERSRFDQDLERDLENRL